MSGRRALKLVLNPSHLPLFLRIAEAVIEEIRQGRLLPGTRLPGTRALSEQLEVHRSTVIAAFKELEDQGWLQSSPASGTFVAKSTQVVKKAAPPRPAQTAGFDFVSPPGEEDREQLGRDVLRFSGAPDVRVMPIDLMARAYRRAQSRRRAVQPNALGHEPLRAAVASMLRDERGLDVNVEQVMIVPRATVAVDLVMRGLLTPGDTIALEALGHRPLREILVRLGAQLAHVEVDGDGLRVAEIPRSPRLRAVWVTPQCQYPTNVALSAPRRAALLELARQHRLAVIEADFLYDFHYGEANRVPLAAEDRTNQVIYLGSLSRVLAPDVQLGYVVAPPEFLRVLARSRQRADRHDEFATQLAVAELIEDGEYQRSLRRTLKIYRRRRDVLVKALRSRLGDTLSFDVPEAGTALWARVNGKLDVEHWEERGLSQKVQFRTALHFAHDRRPRPYLRLGFTQLDEEELVEAVNRLSAAAGR